MKAKLHEDPQRRPVTLVGAEGDDAPLADDSPAGGAFGLPDDRILGEMAHEMGNYFHKLYYWTDYLKTHSGDGSHTDGAAVEMLENTVERLDRFTRMMLEYFAPARLCFAEVRAVDLVSGLANHLAGRRLRLVGVERLGDTAVMADPGLIGHAVATVFDRVVTTMLDEDEVVVRLTPATRKEYRGIEIEFEAGAGAGEASRLTSGIEMAVAEKFFQMHGGELSEREGAPRALIVFMPIYGSDSEQEEGGRKSS